MKARIGYIDDILIFLIFDDNIAFINKGFR